MPQLISVSDPADLRLADYLRLTDGQLRTSKEAAEGLFIAEGTKVIQRAMETGYPVRSLLMTGKWVEILADLIDRVDAPVYVVEEATAEELTGFAVHRGALAAMGRLPLPTMPALVLADMSEQPPRRILVLEDLTNHTNVGAIFRCAAALGIDAIVLAPRCADPLYRRSVKVSMGAVFAVPYARMGDWHGGLATLRGAGFRLLALTPDQGAVPLPEATMGDKVALLLGSEGDGLSSHWLNEADEAVCIPMSPDAMGRGVDSLNVVAAAAIACHSLVNL
ncbi:MAG: RNA methyltransferase [Streptosporangiaceae bacterium]